MVAAGKVGRPIWVRITAYGFTAVLISSVAIGGVALSRQYEDGQIRIRSQQESAEHLATVHLETQRSAVAALAMQIASEPGLGELIAQRAQAEIVGRFGADFKAITGALGANVAVVTDDHGRVVARLHDPLSAGDSILDRPMVATALKTGTFASGNEVGARWVGCVCGCTGPPGRQGRWRG